MLEIKRHSNERFASPSQQHALWTGSIYVANLAAGQLAFYLVWHVLLDIPQT